MLQKRCEFIPKYLTMPKKIFNIICIVVCLSACACFNKTKIHARRVLSYQNDSTFIIEQDIDLAGDTLVFPQGRTLLGKGGLIKNGVVIGNRTKIESDTSIFENIEIQGEWRIPTINCYLFADIHHVNTLRQLTKLASPDIQNTIHILPGRYPIEMKRNDDLGCIITDNTKLIIDGDIVLIPNEYTHYNIVTIKGNRISVCGKGQIIGDKDQHTGRKGEWGMGLRLDHATNCFVQDITIKDCWGDCIYITNKSKNVVIDHCTLLNGRRQGISVIAVDNLKIQNTYIADVHGTAPQHAIDLEPNLNDIIHNVVIEKVTIKNCYGGIQTSIRPDTPSEIDSVRIINCHIQKTGLEPELNILSGTNITIE